MMEQLFVRDSIGTDGKVKDNRLGNEKLSKEIDLNLPSRSFFQ